MTPPKTNHPKLEAVLTPGFSPTGRDSLAGPQANRARTPRPLPRLQTRRLPLVHRVGRVPREAARQALPPPQDQELVQPCGPGARVPDVRARRRAASGERAAVEAVPRLRGGGEGHEALAQDHAEGAAHAPGRGRV